MCVFWLFPESRITSPFTPVDSHNRGNEGAALVWRLTARDGKINSGVHPVNEAVGPTFSLVGQDDVGKEVSGTHAKEPKPISFVV